MSAGAGQLSHLPQEKEKIEKKLKRVVFSTTLLVNQNNHQKSKCELLHTHTHTHLFFFFGASRHPSPPPLRKMRQNQPGLAKTRPRSSLSTPPSKQGQPAGQPRHQIDGQPYARAPFPPLNLQGGTRGDGRGGLVSPRGAAEDGGEGFAALTGARGAAEERASPPAALTGARSRTGESRWRKAGRREGRRGGVCVCPPPDPWAGRGDLSG